MDRDISSVVEPEPEPEPEPESELEPETEPIGSVSMLSGSLAAPLSLSPQAGVGVSIFLHKFVSFFRTAGNKSMLRALSKEMNYRVQILAFLCIAVFMIFPS